MKINLKDIKLIIWDLDETFWNGTLSEHSVDPNAEYIELIKKLSYRGIINSICSKNDFADVQKEFNKIIYADVFDFFVFNSIDWSPKGLRIKNIIDNMQLRAENVLFIDDNVGNLEEVKFYCKDIKVSTPEIINQILAFVDKLGKDDSTLSRLKQYKLLETKQIKRMESSSNEDFLKSSNIVVYLDRDCQKEKDRILELINRTNQMNFTKIRLNENELSSLLNDVNCENAYIKVKDNFGDYGIVGFYTLNKISNELTHFLFSCRILGMGVDQAVYQKLNYPSINIVGDVTSRLSKNNIVDWVKFSKIEDASNPTDDIKMPKVLFKGPCDLESTIPYIKGVKIDTEFIHTNDNAPSTVAKNCLTNIVYSHKYSKEYCRKILVECPVLAPDDYDTKLFENSYDVVFLSTLLEAQIPLYKHKEKGYLIPYGIVNYPFTDKKNWEILKKKESYFRYDVNFNDELLEKLINEFYYIGLPSKEEILKNILYIRKYINDKTKLVLILGSEVDCENHQILGYKQCAGKYREINSYLIEKLKKYPNIEFINMTSFIESQEDFTDCTNHFSRNVYYKLASHINLILNKNHFKSKVKLNRLKISLKIISLRVKLLMCKVKIKFSKKRKKHYEEKINRIKIDIKDYKRVLH